MKKKLIPIVMIMAVFFTSFLANDIANSGNSGNPEGGSDYYFDSRTGNDENSGTNPNSPWQSISQMEKISLQPGDTVYFVRGSSWTGGVQINASGTSKNPIVFTNYGTGNLPKFSNPNWSDYTGNAFRFNGDYLIADGLHFHDVPPPPKGDFITVWKSGAFRIMLGADHNVVRNCYFEKVPKAVQSHGEYTLITNNTMIGEQVLLGSKYWGPIGIQLGIGNQEISYNTISEFWVTENHEWGGDGGAIELDDGRNHKDNISIHHNRTFNNCGFLEISWNYDIAQMEINNLDVSFNVSSDYQSIGFLESKMADNNRINNNTFDRTRQLPHYNTSMEVQIGTPIVRNNLFIMENKDPYQSDDGVHHVDNQNNWYYDVSNPDQVVYPTTAAGNGNPQIVNLTNGGNSDYHLTEKSPLRNIGINLSSLGYTTDFEGKPLPTSGSWDVGAYQY